MSFRAAPGASVRQPGRMAGKGTGGSGPTDPFWSNVVFLLNGNSLTDATGRHTVSVVDGTPTVSDGQVQLDGASSLVATGNLNDFALNGNYTIDFRVKGPQSGAATRVWLSTYIGASGWEIFTRPAPDWNTGIYNEGGMYSDPTAVPVITGNFVNVAFVNDVTANQSRVYIGTSLVATLALNNTPAANALYIGRENAGSTKYALGGLNCRITQAVRYTGGTFTPPTWPVPTS